MVNVYRTNSSLFRRPVNLNIIIFYIAKEKFPPEMFEITISSTPMGRLSEVEDAVELVIFLLSDKSLMISGTNHVLDDKVFPEISI